MGTSLAKMEGNLYVILCATYFALFIQRCESNNCMQDEWLCIKNCCLTPEDTYKCCHMLRPIVIADDDMDLMIGSVVVICSCVVLAVIFVICCFCGRCPLSNTCRVNYTQGHVIAYHDDDDTLSSIMPPDDGQNHYVLNAVKIKPVEDV